MKILKYCLTVLAGVLFISGALFIRRAHYAPLPVSDDFCKFRNELEALPDYDYVSEIRRLIRLRRYGDARVLCDDVRQLELPGADEAGILTVEIDRESGKVWNRICKAGRAFITGNPDSSIEEIGGSIASDMVIYGDIRDLSRQGWFKITGRETDSLIILLSSAGLVTEFVDAADWVPAALKAMKKTGAITGELASSLTGMLKGVVQTGKLDGSTKMFLKNTGQMLDSAGFVRTRNIFKGVEHADELKILAESAKADPALTHLTARHAGSQTGALLAKSPPGLLRQIVRKGRLALRLVKTHHKHRTVLNRTFWQNLPDAAAEALTWGFAGAGSLLIVTGVLLMLRMRLRSGRESAAR